MKLIKKSSKKNKDIFENLEAATFDALIQEGEPHISDLANFYTRCFLAHPPRNMYLFVIELWMFFLLCPCVNHCTIKLLIE